MTENAESIPCVVVVQDNQRVQESNLFELRKIKNLCNMQKPNTGDITIPTKSPKSFIVHVQLSRR
ncbi:14381_t:CDS:2 [Acaulospora colombiana]|uniref:14381_t:CDS:1 n=1 Tax=Acaulospora colombiana TaxID=27376 RepID=A0ACA9LI85_9GLOM|nr:14381_t:CDS:2 [Acaulospora colombiana]